MDVDSGLFRGIVDELETAVYVVDREMRLLYWNRGAERVTGYAAPDVLGQRGCSNLPAHVDEEGHRHDALACPLAATLEDGVPRQENSLLRHRSGHVVPARVRMTAVYGSDGRIEGAVARLDEGVSSVWVRERISQLEQLASVDPVTGLANRRFAELSLRQLVAEMARYHRTFGVLMLDVDGFSQLNETHGHLEGDRVLQMVARALAKNSRPFDVVGRWGGDEFLILVRNVDRVLLGRVAAKFSRMVAAQSLEMGGGRSLSVTVSCGAVLAEPGDTQESLVARAGQALYIGKRTRYGVQGIVGARASSA